MVEEREAQGWGCSSIEDCLICTRSWVKLPAAQKKKERKRKGRKEKEGRKERRKERKKEGRRGRRRERKKERKKRKKETEVQRVLLAQFS
jgi:hypothetical protein